MVNYSTALHLHPLDYDFSSLPCLSSTQLALLQFHIHYDSTNEQLPLLIFRVWSTRREKARVARLKGLKVEEGLHTIDLSFGLENLKELTSEQLAVVGFHPDGNELIQLRAESIWRGRREKDLSRGFVWGKAPVELVEEKVVALEEVNEKAREQVAEVVTSIQGNVAAPLPDEKTPSPTPITRPTEDASSTKKVTLPRATSVVATPSSPPLSSSPVEGTPPRPSTALALPLASTSFLPATAPTPTSVPAPGPVSVPVPASIPIPVQPPALSTAPTPTPIPTARPTTRVRLPPSLEARIHSLNIFNLPLTLFTSQDICSLFPSHCRPEAAIILRLLNGETTRVGYVGFASSALREMARKKMEGVRVEGRNVGVKEVEEGKPKWEWADLNTRLAGELWSLEIGREKLTTTTTTTSPTLPTPLDVVPPPSCSSTALQSLSNLVDTSNNQWGRRAAPPPVQSTSVLPSRPSSISTSSHLPLSRPATTSLVPISLIHSLYQLCLNFKNIKPPSTLFEARLRASNNTITASLFSPEGVRGLVGVQWKFRESRLCYLLFVSRRQRDDAISLLRRRQVLEEYPTVGEARKEEWEWCMFIEEFRRERGDGDGFGKGGMSIDRDGEMAGSDVTGFTADRTQITSASVAPQPLPPQQSSSALLHSAQQEPLPTTASLPSQLPAQEQTWDPTLDTTSRRLPDGWRRDLSQKYDEFFYVHDVSERSSWENPLDLLVSESGSGREGEVELVQGGAGAVDVRLEGDGEVDVEGGVGREEEEEVGLREEETGSIDLTLESSPILSHSSFPLLHSRSRGNSEAIFDIRGLAVSSSSSSAILHTPPPLSLAERILSSSSSSSSLTTTNAVGSLSDRIGATSSGKGRGKNDTRRTSIGPMDTKGSNLHAASGSKKRAAAVSTTGGGGGGGGGAGGNQYPSRSTTNPRDTEYQGTHYDGRHLPPSGSGELAARMGEKRLFSTNLNGNEGGGAGKKLKGNGGNVGGQGKKGSLLGRLV